MRTAACLSRSLLTAISVTVTCLLMVPVVVAADYNSDFDQSRIVIRLSPTGGPPQKFEANLTGRPEVDALLGDIGVTAVRQVFPPQPVSHPYYELERNHHLADWAVIEVPAGADPKEVLSQIKSLPGVVTAEFDRIWHIAGATVMPDDPYFTTHQYSLYNTGTQPPWDPGTPGADIEMTAAWDITTGDSSIIIAIIDTGIDFAHPEFFERIWTNPGEGSDGLDLDSNGYVDDQHGYDFANGDPNPSDDHQHGSHVSGIAAASGNNATGIAGINWGCRIMPLKVLNANGSGTSSHIAEAIVYAVNEGAKVINLSLGGGYASVTASAVAYAVAADVIVCAAMGNDNSGDPFYPAALDSVISVGATNSRDERALGELCVDPVVEGSNFGPWIDVCAAGDNVWSTIPVSMGSYGRYCLTSQATPHVVGLASLILTLRPDYPGDSVRQLIRMSAEDQVGRPEEDTPGFDIYHGWGRINARAALQALVTDFPPIIEVPGPQNVTELETLIFAVSATDSNFTYPALSATSLPNAIFTDSGNGIGTFEFTPDLLQQGTYDVVFTADDGAFTDQDTVTVTVADGCLCENQGDIEPDGFITSLDLSACIDILFAGAGDVQDVGCPDPRFDLDCDGFTTSLDLSIIIDHLFAGGPGPCDPCAP
jgi:thermitase